MTVRARPTLVRSGPYRVVRHPIYSGLLLAAIGSALVTGPGWLVVVVGAGAYFVVSLRVEESDLASAFPEQYPSTRSYQAADSVRVLTSRRTSRRRA